MSVYFLQNVRYQIKCSLSVAPSVLLCVVRKHLLPVILLSVWGSVSAHLEPFFIEAQNDVLLNAPLVCYDLCLLEANTNLLTGKYIYRRYTVRPPSLTILPHILLKRQTFLLIAHNFLPGNSKY